jgi:hypothetical protein
LVECASSILSNAKGNRERRRQEWQEA